MPFTKGHKIVGNRNGRPPGSKNKISQKLFNEFLNTIREVEQDEKISQGKTLFKHIISRGFKNDAVAMAILRKLVPDRTFNIEDFQSGDIRVTFEIVESEQQKEKKEGQDLKNLK